MEIDVYFQDLLRKRQKEILRYLGIKDKDIHKLNWDILPIATVIIPEDTVDEIRGGE